jgi:dienelactone hydrolase
MPPRLARPRLRRALRIVAITGIATALLPCAFLAWLFAPVLRDPSPSFLARRGEVVEARLTASRQVSDGEIRELTLRSSTGLEVELSVRIPLHAISPRPTVVLLAGQRTGRDAVQLVAATRGNVVAALSYPRRIERTTGNSLRRARAVQRAILDTTPAVLLATDWLAAQPYVDPRRMELAGGSLGAFLVVPAGAIEPRFRRVWLVHGAGDAAGVIDHGLREQFPYRLPRRWFSHFAAAAVGTRWLAPERWVGKVSPRPVVVINALDDESMPAESVRALHVALGEPHEVIWMPGGHVRTRRTDVIEQITEIIFSRIADEG